jgi:uncharacterized membrane protein YbhN (UPF0104 family)
MDIGDDNCLLIIFISWFFLSLIVFIILNNYFKLYKRRSFRCFSVIIYWIIGWVLLLITIITILPHYVDSIPLFVAIDIYLIPLSIIIISHLIVYILLRDKIK